MSAQDQRTDIIQEYIPQLVRQLTGFEVSRIPLTKHLSLIVHGTFPFNHS